MTEEQIKQNAFDEAVKYSSLGYEQTPFADGYIAGAHSRDKKIEELKRIINEQDSIICSLDCEDRVSIIKQRDKLIEENNKLRNPWISVEDRLPDIGQKVITITNKGKMLLVARTTQPPHKEEGGWRWEHYIGNVTHWMPIPELKK